MDDSDYDTADILNISRELYRSLEEGKAGSVEPSSVSSRKGSFNIRDILPPPPDHLLHDTFESSNASTPELERASRVDAERGHMTNGGEGERSMQGGSHDQVPGIGDMRQLEAALR